MNKINASNRELKEEDLRGIFKEFDLNGDGYIQKDELNAVMVKMGQCPTDDELNAMFDAADKDKDGNIDFDGIFFRPISVCDKLYKDIAYDISTHTKIVEFLSIAYANPLSLSLKAVFDELDVDGDGCITRSELRTAFQRMGHKLTDSDIKAIYNQVDVNRDGKINFDGNELFFLLKLTTIMVISLFWTSRNIMLLLRNFKVFMNI
ncbi:unnamed protein product [Brugia timori]|uniref:EF hand family protein n=1 Tax=Brugia timori TaxID=42155 RepID=A0A0R3QUA6_9BILA|nr:unnamed protein product [Brugia timori]